MSDSKIKVVAMDLDGTLTQHRQQLGEANKETLNKLAQKYKLLMVGAGQVMRIFNQMECFPIDIIGNYGLQYGIYNTDTQSIDVVRDLQFSVDKATVEEKVTFLREKYGYTDYAGDSVEFHP